MRVTRFLAVALFLSTFSGVIAWKGAAQTAGPPLTNQDIVALTAAGLPDDVIVAKIHQAPSVAFDTSVAALTSLKTAGVSSVVIRVMIDPKAVPVAPAPAIAVATYPATDPDNPNSLQSGIYMQLKGDDGKQHLLKLQHISPDDQKMPGFGSSLATAYSFGLHKSKSKAVIPGTKAQAETANSSPVFFDYTGDESIQQMGLVKFEVKGENREVTTFAVGGIFNGGIAKGPTANEKQGFQAEMVRPGVYKITFAQPLEPGAYAFGSKGATTFMYWDFDILRPQ